MPGCLSYVIVLFSAVLLLSALSLLSAARSSDLSGAIAIERAYGLLMNAKECALEAVRGGASGGFDAYDSSHELSSCRHCPDQLCMPPTPAEPLPPNVCDEALCARCFREPEARFEADNGALIAYSFLQGRYPGGDDFSTSFGFLRPGGVESFLVPDAAKKNGLRMGSVRFREGLPITVQSPLFDIILEGSIPEGTEVRYGTGHA